MRAFALYKSPQGWLQDVGENNGSKEADKGGEADTTDGRMLGNEHAANGSNEHDGTQEDGGLVVVEYRVLAGQPVHDKNTVVNADAEDEGGDNDADEVELYIEEHHHTQHNQPAEQDGSKGQQRVAPVEMERQP